MIWPFKTARQRLIEERRAAWAEENRQQNIARARRIKKLTVELMEQAKATQRPVKSAYAVVSLNDLLTIWDIADTLTETI